VTFKNLEKFLGSQIPKLMKLRILKKGKDIVLAMRWLFTTSNVISRNVTAKKQLVTTW